MRLRRGCCRWASGGSNTGLASEWHHQSTSSRLLLENPRIHAEHMLDSGSFLKSQLLLLAIFRCMPACVRFDRCQRSRRCSVQPSCCGDDVVASSFLVMLIVIVLQRLTVTRHPVSNCQSNTCHPGQQQAPRDRIFAHFWYCETQLSGSGEPLECAALCPRPHGYKLNYNITLSTSPDSFDARC